MTMHDHTVGPVVQSDSTYEGQFRTSRDSALVVSDDHGRWYEQGSRGQVYTVSTPLGGVVMTTAMIAPPGAAAATLLTLLNPIGSGVNLEIIQGWVGFIAGTPQNGAWSWCGIEADVSITAAEAGVTKGALRDPANVPHVRAWSNAALTGGPAQVNVRPFLAAQFNAALATTTPDQLLVDNVDGAIVLLPGSLITIAPANVINTIPGPDCTVAAGIMFAEVPRSPRSP